MRRHILIIHGWMHSARRYDRLKADLEKSGLYEVTLFELPGFGDTPGARQKHLLEYYGDQVRKELEKRPYDWAIGHSMGGSVLLRAMTGWEGNTKLILLSPEYSGIALLKPVSLPVPVTAAVFLLAKKGPYRAAAFFIKMMALFTINRWNQIDDRIIEDARRADPVAAALTMRALAWDGWRIERGQWKCPGPILILGEKDRIIAGKNMRRLIRDLGGGRGSYAHVKVYCLKGTGHTAVVENYAGLLNMLMKMIK